MSAPLVLVTGAAGFIGSNVVATLCASGLAEVAACDWLGPADLNKWRNLAKHPIADLITPEQMFGWLDGHARELSAVVHMGAISSTMEPDADLILNTNFGLSRDLWRWCAKAGVRLLWASSAATYGAGEQGFEEDDSPDALARLRPLNAYGWSKALFDLLAARQAERGQAPPQWAGLKFFNVYGPNEGHKGAMRSVAAQIWPRVRDGEPVELFRSYRQDVPDGGQMRDFVYVKDAADITAWLLSEPLVSGVFNVGSGTARSFEDLARATFTAAGREPLIRYKDMPEALRDTYQYFTCASMGRLSQAGYPGQATPLEAGVADYVKTYLSTGDPWR